MTTPRISQPRSVLLAGFIAALVFAAANLAAAQTETEIHVLQSTSKYDGNGPYGLVTDGTGALYGVTAGGGKYNHGAVYKLAPPSSPGGVWKQNILYSFTGGADGEGPSGGLFFNTRNHRLYGMTEYGGGGVGVVYELTPGSPWTETVIHTFGGITDGEYPYGGLISDNRGTLYGTASQGGSHDSGVVFRLSPTASGGAWNEAVLYAFGTGQQNDGSNPYAGLVMDGNGVLYGTTLTGGENTLGTVFQVVPPPGGKGRWTEITLHSFAGYTDGQAPFAGLILDGNGALYGTTEEGGLGGVECGCGTVFKLTPPATQGAAWTESILYVFTGGADGGYPYASVILDSTGALYGATGYGGDTAIRCSSDYDGCGTIFTLSPPSTQGAAWTESVLHSFQSGSDGAYPLAPLLLVGTTFYGTSFQGGTPGAGTVFEITP